MRFAVKVTESLTRTIIVDGDNYEEAVDKVMNEYNNGNLVLHADNSTLELECNDDTENYLEIFGNDEFEKMDVLEKV